jgi:hypothetical protein
MSKATTKAMEHLVDDYEDLLSGDLSRLNIVSEPFRNMGERE